MRMACVISPMSSWVIGGRLCPRPTGCFGNSAIKLSRIAMLAGVPSLHLPKTQIRITHCYTAINRFAADWFSTSTGPTANERDFDPQARADRIESGRHGRAFRGRRGRTDFPVTRRAARSSVDVDARPTVTTRTALRPYGYERTRDHFSDERAAKLAVRNSK
jgi:hypothetical protein